MGAPKQKWTDSEEQALKAGIEKYGPGKWRAIQKDPKFGPMLTQRSNVDLKDKWRNMSLNAEGVTTPREKTPKAQEKAKSPLALTAKPHKAEKLFLTGGSSSNALALVPVGEHGVLPPGATQDMAADAAAADAAALKKAALNPKYEEMITQAVTGLKEVEGSASGSIIKFIEEKHAVPSNFRRILPILLKSLVEKGKLLRQNQKYRIPEEGAVPVKKTVRKELLAIEGIPVPKEKVMDATKMGKFAKAKADVEQARSKMKTAEEAARAAALAVAEAEAAAAAAEQAACEAEQAEAEAEAAEAMAEAAAAAVRPPKKRAKDKAMADKGKADNPPAPGPALALMPPPPPPPNSTSALSPSPLGVAGASTSTSPGPPLPTPPHSLSSAPLPMPAAVPTRQ